MQKINGKNDKLSAEKKINDLHKKLSLHIKQLHTFQEDYIMFL